MGGARLRESADGATVMTPEQQWLRMVRSWMNHPSHPEHHKYAELTRRLDEARQRRTHE